MNKFEHFTEKEMDAVCKGAYFALTDTGDDRFNGLTVCLSSEFYKETAANIINRALEAELVQRVVDDKSQDENKVKIGVNEYTLKKLPDGKIWMMENLREEVEDAVWNEKYNCYMYTFDEAQKAVPEGFHLPSPREFMELALSLGYLEEDGTVVANSFIKECNFTLSGHSTDTGILCNQGINGLYWTSEQGSETFGYSLNLESSSVKPDTNFPKYNGLAVRCIKD